jgi:D-sedoheptulose 7-phosphate isomerase
MNTLETIYSELTASRKVLDAFIMDKDNLQSIQSAANIMINCLKNGGKIIACGNGGSMCDAMHFASELTGRYRKDRAPIAAMAISDPAHLSCVGNDYGYDYVFNRYIRAHGKEGDVLLALSTSGNSENVNLACLEAGAKNIHVVFLTGATGGLITGLSAIDSEIRVPSDLTARIQEVHIKIIHILVHLVEKGLGYE